MKLFSTIDEVFEKPSEIYKTLFFPLLTVDLEEMEKGKGKVHFVSVWGDGGADDFMLFDDMSFGMEFIKFDWTGEKYLFNDNLFNPKHTEILLKWYAGLEKEYTGNKIEFLTKRSDKESWEINDVREKKWKKISHDYYMYAAQLINYWVTRDKFFETGQFIQGGAYTHGRNDEVRKTFISLSKTKATTRSNELIGKVCGYNYKINGEDEIALYIDRKENKVFQKFNWT
jgi:hypothetical protein